MRTLHNSNSRTVSWEPDLKAPLVFLVIKSLETTVLDPSLVLSGLHHYLYELCVITKQNFKISPGLESQHPANYSLQTNSHLFFKELDFKLIIE